MACVASLRQAVHDCLAKHMYSTAIFYADKVSALSRLPGDWYLLAQATYCAGQWRRCLHILQNNGLVNADVRFVYLAAKYAWVE